MQWAALVNDKRFGLEDYHDSKKNATRSDFRRDCKSIFQHPACTLAEKGGYRLFARMPKGRVAQIVREACSRHNVAEMVEMLGSLATLRMNATRSDFRRDYDRLVFSSPFRRLQNKTQVFPLPGSIFVHNRLTHSIITGA